MRTTLPGVSSEDAAQQLSWQDQAMRPFGEVASVFGKVGRAETGTDPAAALSRHQVDLDVARATVDLIASGGQIGELELDGQRFRVRVSPEIPEVTERRQLDTLREITVRGTSPAPLWANEGRLVAPPPQPSQPVPLALVGKPTYSRLPAALRTEKGELCAYVHVDLAAGADVQSYVTRARQEVDNALASGAIQIAPNERIEWTGQYELLHAGGLATSAFLTLEVLPVLYTIWRTRQLKRAQRLGVPIASVVGEAPSWART
jgi:Cu/Ag efflux pump CusA